MTLPRSLPLMLAVLAVALIFIVVAQIAVEPWGDEAMLLANLLDPDLDIFAPLPLYEQAAPVGYLWLCRVLFDLFGSAPPFQVLRLLSAAFVGLGIALLLSLKPIRRDGLAATILVAVLLGEVMIWSYASEIKHYSAEFFGSALVLAFSLPLAQQADARTCGLFLGAVVIAGLISFTAPVVVAGLLAGLGVYRLLAEDAGARPFAPAFIITGVLAVLYVAAVYLLLNRGLVAWQLQAYAHVYSLPPDLGLASLAVKRLGSTLQVVANALGHTWLSGARDVLQQFGLPVGLSFHLVRLLALILFVALALVARKRAPELVTVTLGVFVAMAALHVSGFLAMPYERHAIFLIPFSAAMTAVAVSHVLGKGLPVAAGAVIAGAVVAGALLFGAVTTLARQTQEMGRMLGLIQETAPDVPVWVHSAAQPVFDVLTPRPKNVLDPMDASSGPVAWQIRGGSQLLEDGVAVRNPDYPASLAKAAAGLARLWLLFDTDPATEDHAPFLVVAEESVGPCTAEIETRGGALYLCTRSPSAFGDGG